MSQIQPITTYRFGLNIQEWRYQVQKYKDDTGMKLTIKEPGYCYSTDIEMPVQYSDVNNYAKCSAANTKKSDIEESNQLDFRGSKSYRLGNYNGVSIDLKMVGGKITTPVHVPPSCETGPGEKVNPMFQEIMNRWKKVGERNLEEIFNSCQALDKLIDVSNKNIPVQALSAGETQTIKDTLLQLGVNTYEPFAINGEEFYIRSDNGRIDYLSPKKYVTKSDGRIEIKDVSNYYIDEKKRIIEI